MRQSLELTTDATETCGSHLSISSIARHAFQLRYFSLILAL